MYAAPTLNLYVPIHEYAFIIKTFFRYYPSILINIYHDGKVFTFHYFCSFIPIYMYTLNGTCVFNKHFIDSHPSFQSICTPSFYSLNITSHLLLSRLRYPVRTHTFASPCADSRWAVVSYGQKYMHLVLVNRLGGLSLSRNNAVKVIDRPDMTIAVYLGC